MAGYKGDKTVVDPMCGSGTILIEAALIALKIAPGPHAQVIWLSALERF